MKKVFLTTFGSYGDLHPYIAMALVLKLHGYEVCLGSHAQYRNNVERLGIRFIPVKPSQDDLGPEENWIKQSNDLRKGAEFIIKNLMLPYLEESYADVEQEVKNSDLVISHILCFATPIAAEKYSVPWISTILQPSTLFSVFDPPRLGQALFLERFSFLGPAFFRMLTKLIKWETNRWLAPVHSLRQRLQLPVTKRNPLLEGFSPLASLMLFPDAFACAQRDWPQNSIQLPFPFYDQEDTGEISAGLQNFLKDGDAPIVYTLGTAIIRLQSRFFADAYEATKRLGRRSIFLVGKQHHGVPKAAYENPDIYISEYEPFSALFPYCSVIVHQCGVGTTAQALRAGKPQVLVPFAHDQPDNARIVESKGLGIGIKVGSLSEQTLFSSLEAITRNDQWAKRAEAFAVVIQKQNFEAEFWSAIKKYL